MSTIFLSVIFGYILPGALYWNWVRRVHSKGGKYEMINSDGSDVFLVLCPGANLIGYVSMFDRAKRSEPLETNKFFKIKK